MAPAPKRRKLADKAERVEELTFDPSARQEYLTGFHKRKQARIQSAREAAIKREKEEKVRERKQLREQRKEDLEQHVAAVNEELKKQNAVLNGDSTEAEDEDEGAWNGIKETEVEIVAQEEELPDEEEYVDEDKYTTVTVEAMGESDDDDVKPASIGEETASVTAAPAGNKKKRPWTKDGSAKTTVKKKKFRYESKAERAVTRQKQKSKNRVAKARRKGN